MEKFKGEPLKIFISYGHDEKTANPACDGRMTQADLCHMICDALKSRGHEPWLDVSDNGISEGDDWRAAIQKGIKESDEVLFCISNRSIREGSVCLEEFKRAMGRDGMGAGKLYSILLEPELELETQVPSWLSERQRFDFTGWKDFDRDADDESFKAWFDGRMGDLCEKLESDSRFYARDIQKVMEILRPETDIISKDKVFRDKDEADRFTGRKWMSDRVEKWIDDQSGERICLITGAPGIGKSAFAAHFAQGHREIKADVYFRFQNDRRNTLCDAIRSIAFCMAGKLEHYRRELLDVLQEQKAEWANENRADFLFEQLIVKPLEKTIDGGHGVNVILMDGLDECGEEDLQNLLEFLGRGTRQLPKWLRFLILSREEPKFSEYLYDARRLPLKPDDEGNRSDIRGFCEKRLWEKFGGSGDADFQKALDDLTDRSEGIFLYAEMACDMLLDMLQKEEISGFSKAVSELPRGLYEVLPQWFQRAFGGPAAYKDKYRKILQVIVGAPLPITRMEIKRLLGCDEYWLDDFIKNAGMLLRIGRDELACTREEREEDKDYETLEIRHKFIQEWLTGRDNTDYHASAEEGGKKLAGFVYGIFEDFEQGDEELTRYEAAVLPELLRRQERARVLGVKRKKNALYGSDAFLNLLINEGAVCREWGNMDAAERFYQEGQELIDERQKLVNGRPRHEDPDAVNGERLMFARFYHAYGEFEQLSGNYESAEKLYQKASDWIGREDSANNTKALKTCAKIQGSLAELKKAHGDFFGALALWEESRKNYEEACSAGKTLADRNDLAKIYVGIAEIAQLTGEEEKAEHFFKKAGKNLASGVGADDDKELRQISARSVVTAKRAKLLAEMGKPQEMWEAAQIAEGLADRAVSERGYAQDIENLLNIKLFSADKFKAEGNIQEAYKYYLEALEEAGKLSSLRGMCGDRMTEAEIHIRIAKLMSEQEWETAASYCGKAWAIAEELRQEGADEQVLNFYIRAARTYIDILWLKPDENRETLKNICGKALQTAKLLKEKRRGVADQWTYMLLSDLERFLDGDGGDAKAFIDKESAAWYQFRTESLGIA